MADTPATGTTPPQNTMAIVGAAGDQPGQLRCCCGNEECIYLRHSSSVLSSVERDVHTAARMGQVSPSRRIP